MAKNVFVLGLDGSEKRRMLSIRRPEEFRFHPLLEPEDVHGARDYRFGPLLSTADHTLSAFKGTVDGLVNLWDFPVTAIHAVLCRKYDLLGPPLQSVVRCDHRYWSRLLQTQVTPQHVPRFHAFDPFDSSSLDQIPLRYPFWIRPVIDRGTSLAFEVHDQKELRRRVTRLQEKIGRTSRPFAEALPRFDPPVGAEHVDGRWCIAEAPSPGHRCSVEGYVHRGAARVYAMIDTVPIRDGTSTLRAEYPSVVPDPVKRRIGAVTRRVMEHIGYDNAAFTVQWAWHEPDDQLHILDILPRIEPAFSELLEKVNGYSNFEAPVELSVGNEPNVKGQNGIWDKAAVVTISHYEDGLVERVPGPQDLQQLERSVPGTTVQLNVDEGMRLSEIPGEGPHSFSLATATIGGRDQEEIRRKAEQVQRRLNFQVRPGATARHAPAAFG